MSRGLFRLETASPWALDDVLALVLVGPVWQQLRDRADPLFRFWLAFLGPHLAEVDRMRSDLTLDRIERSWSDWRGRAVEPLAREALARLLPAERFRDQSSGVIMRVWLDPDGARHYVPD